MVKQAAARHPNREGPPALDRRLERFVQRYIDSPLKLEIMRLVARYPNRLHSLVDLEALLGAASVDIERAAMDLESLGLLQRRRRGGAWLIGLSRSPVVRELSVMLCRYASKPGGHQKLISLVRPRS